MVRMIRQLPSVLRVFVSSTCPLTKRVAEVTAEIQRRLPSLHIEIVDIDMALEPLPDVVFSVPTYVLNGRVVSRGNPDANFVDELRALLNHEGSCKIGL